MRREVILNDLVKIDSGYAFKSELFNDKVKGIPIIRIRDVNSGVAGTFYSGEYDEKYIVNRDDLLISMDGNFVIKSWNSEKALLNQRVCRISSKSSMLLNRYIYWILPNELKIIEDKTPFVTVKHLSVKDINNIVISLPSIDIQAKIIGALDKAKDLIDKRKAQIEGLDELIKSVFYDMFGEPVNNTMEWDIKKIGELFDVKSGSTPSRKENSYWENGTIPWVKTAELKGNIIINAEEFITMEGFENSSVSLFPKDSILIAMYGQGKTRGMSAKLGIDATTNQACAAIIPNGKDSIDFLWFQIKIRYDDLRKLGRGGNQPNLNSNIIKQYDIIYPPNEMQIKYVKLVQKIEYQKELMQQSLTQLENNFNVIMQKAFNGELFN